MGLTPTLVNKDHELSRRAAERGNQFPPSDFDWHVPLSVRGLPSDRNDTTPRASGLHVREGGMPMLRRNRIDRSGSCVTSIAGPNGDAQLYER